MCCSKAVRLILIFLCAVLLAGCTAQSVGEAKILSDDQQTTTGNVQTTPVVMNSLSRAFSQSAEVSYVHETIVLLEIDEALFVENLVKIGNTVKAGDPIAVFRKEVDTLRLTEITQQLDSIEVQRQDGLEDRTKQREDLQEQLDDLNDLKEERQTYRVYLDKQTLQMEMEKLDIEEQRFLLRLDEQKRKLEKELQEIHQAEKDLVVTAPVDGVIGQIHYLSPGVTCHRGQEVAIIYDPEKYLLLSNSNVLGSVRVGQNVTVEYGPRTGRKTVPGHVVAADDLLPAEMKSGMTAVELEEYMDPDELMNISVQSELMHVENVLTLPQKTLQYEDGTAFVEVINDGAISKRYVTVGPNDGTNVMILAGLEEGQSVVIR